MTRFTGLDLQTYANSLPGGYLKDWKANTIVNTLANIPDIITDKERLIKYLWNSLAMEGFTDQEIDLIVVWIGKQA